MIEGLIPQGIFTRLLALGTLAILLTLLAFRFTRGRMPKNVERRLVWTLVLLLVAFGLIATSERPEASFDRLAWGGLLTGSVIALSAIGLTLVYGILNLPNFSHGDLLTLGAYLAFLFTVGFMGADVVPTTLALILLVVGAVAFDRYRSRALSREERSALLSGALLLGAALAGLFWDSPLRGRFLYLPEGALPLLGALALVGGVSPFAARLAGRREAAWLPLLPMAGVAGIALALASLAGSHQVSYAYVLTILVGLGAAAWIRWRSPRGHHVPFVVVVPAALAALLYSSAFQPRAFILSAFLAVVGTIVFVILLDVVLWRPLRRRGANIVTRLIVSIGVALALRHALQLVFGGNIQRFARGSLSPKVVATITYNEVQVFLIGSAAFLILGTHLFLSCTRVGKALRALADNPDLARATGVDVDRVTLYLWALAGGLAGAGGVLYAYWRTLEPTTGWDILLPTFAAVILGGIGSPLGALAGAITIGVAMDFSTVWIHSGYKPAIAFAILIVLLLVRPQGLFGGRMQ